MVATSHLYCAQCGAGHPLHAHFCRLCGCALPVDQSRLEGSVSSSEKKRVLKQRYRVLKQVGSGGYGVVYKAADIQFGQRHVAVKEMSQRGLSPEEIAEATDAFKREAFMLAGLTHPNLPSIYDYFIEDGRCYLVMSFIEGETLEDYLKRAKDGCLPVEKVLHIGVQLSSVLSYLHTRNPSIIFRDLKPANVMRTPEGLLYLIDFGIARHFKHGQAKDTLVLGSPGYAAPEQYGRAQTTPQTDVYSLGATLHQLLAGDDPALSPFSHAPLNLPACPALAHLITCMLDRDARKRPASMANIMRELQRMIAGRSRTLAAHHTFPPQNPASASVVPVARHNRPAAALPPARGQVPLLYSSARQLPAPRSPQPLAYYNHLLGTSVADAYSSLLTGLKHALDGVAHAASAVPQQISAHVVAVDPKLIAGKLPPTALLSVAWSPDGQRIATADRINGVRLWDVAQQKPLVTYAQSMGIGITALAWSPDGKRIVSASANATAQMWDADTGNLLYTYAAHRGPVQAVAWSPDGRYIASADAAHVVLIWDAATYRTCITYARHRQPVTSVSWSPNNRSVASASVDGTVQVWDVLSSRCVLTYALHNGVVEVVAWSPDGKLMASAGADRTVQVWNALHGSHVCTYQGYSERVRTVSWSPDSTRIAAGSWDKTVQIWYAVAGSNASTYNQHVDRVSAVAWSPDGKQVAIGDASGKLHVWFPRQTS